ncbi:sialic acid-binding Ig-like lectin 10 [Aplochiton taeniatus]
MAHQRRVSALYDLHVTFPPKDVKVQVLTLSVQEGSNVLLTCSCKADPPVTQYGWSYTQHGHTINPKHKTHSIRVYNVSRDTRVRCSAQNRIGQGESQPIALDIQYKPGILPLSSSCFMEGSEVMCQCLVDSNPKPAITWSVNGSVPPSGYNMSVTSEPGGLIASLRGHMPIPLRVVCFAFNALGNDSSTLLQDGEVMFSLLWYVIPAAAISVTVLLLSLILMYCCRRKAGKRVLSCRPPAVYPGETGIYQDQMPLYINCNEVSHIYTNGSYQLVYQNCTPLFVRTKQACQMGRRGGERRLRTKSGGERSGGENGHLRSGATRVTQSPATAEIETAIYLEII